MGVVSTQADSSLIERAAKTAHEVNRIYALSLGDTSHERWENAPAPVRRSAIAGVAYLMRHPEAGPQAQHDAWLEQRTEEGWTWGPEKDSTAKTHPCLVPYKDLPVFEKLKDSLFQTVVRGVLGLEEAK